MIKGLFLLLSPFSSAYRQDNSGLLTGIPLKESGDVIGKMYLEEACKLVESDSELFLGLCDNLFDESSPDLSNSVKNAENFISSEIWDRVDY